MDTEPTSEDDKSTHHNGERPNKQRIVHDRQESQDQRRRDGLHGEEEGVRDGAEGGCCFSSNTPYHFCIRLEIGSDDRSKYQELMVLIVLRWER